MTEAANSICKELAERFPASAASDGGLAMRLSVAKSFPCWVSAAPDVKESFLEAAEELQRLGIVGLSWKRFRGGDELSAIKLLNPRGLYTLLGLVYPPDELAAACDAARDAASALEDSESFLASRTFLLWASENMKPGDTQSSRDGAISPVGLPSAVSDLGRLLAVLPAHTRNGLLSGTTARALSIRLFADSKRLERILELLAPLCARAKKAGLVMPDLSVLQRNYPQTLVSGRLEFVLATGERIANEAGTVVGFTLSGASSMSVIAALARKAAESGPRLLTVENLETFYALSESQLDRGFDAVMYSGGHPNRVVQLLAAAFARSGFSIVHAGDLDPDGILIVQELSDAASVPVVPLRMDAATFDEYCEHGRQLDDQSIRRLDLVRSDTLAISGIADLVQRMRTTGKGVEQEIISY